MNKYNSLVYYHTLSKFAKCSLTKKPKEKYNEYSLSKIKKIGDWFIFADNFIVKASKVVVVLVILRTKAKYKTHASFDFEID